MPVWKFCIALIREYGLFTELKNLDFSKLAPVINKVVTIPLKNGEPLKVQYREIDKVLRTIPDEGLAFKELTPPKVDVKKVVEN